MTGYTDPVSPGHLSSSCSSILIIEVRPSRCTSPEIAVVRTTASLGSGSLDSFSSTVNVASDPSPTMKVTPPTSPIPRSLKAEVGRIVGVGEGSDAARDGVEVGVDGVVSVGPGAVSVGIGLCSSVSVEATADLVAAGADVGLAVSAQAAVERVKTAASPAIHHILLSPDPMTILIKAPSNSLNLLPVGIDLAKAVPLITYQTPSTFMMLARGGSSNRPLSWSPCPDKGIPTAKAITMAPSVTHHRRAIGVRAIRIISRPVKGKTIAARGSMNVRKWSN